MNIEIERKFLMADDSWRAEAGEGVHYAQGYLNKKGNTVRRECHVGIEPDPNS